MKDDFAETADPREEKAHGKETRDPASDAERPAAAEVVYLPVSAKEKLISSPPGKPLRGMLRPVPAFLSKAAAELRRVFKKDTVPNLVLVMALLTVITAAGVGGIYAATEEKIGQAREEAFGKAMGNVFPGMDLQFTQSSIGENVYEGRDSDGNLQGFAILVSPNGQNGPIDMIVGIDILREVTDVYIVAHREIRDYSEAVAQGAGEALAALDRGARP